jgi:hypothetical protein
LLFVKSPICFFLIHIDSLDEIAKHHRKIHIPTDLLAILQLDILAISHPHPWHLWAFPVEVQELLLRAVQRGCQASRFCRRVVFFSGMIYRMAL